MTDPERETRLVTKLLRLWFSFPGGPSSPLAGTGDSEVPWAAARPFCRSAGGSALFLLAIAMHLAETEAVPTDPHFLVASFNGASPLQRLPLVDGPAGPVGASSSDVVLDLPGRPLLVAAWPDPLRAKHTDAMEVGDFMPLPITP